MPKFIVQNTPILHNGKRYDIGAEIELTDEQAANNAINLKAVVEDDKAKKEAERLAAEKAAEAERLAEEKAAEAERLAAEKAAEAERLAEEKAAKTAAKESKK